MLLAYTSSVVQSDWGSGKVLNACLWLSNFYPVTCLSEIKGGRKDLVLCMYLKFGVYHEARQPSKLFSPDRFRCFW